MQMNETINKRSAQMKPSLNLNGFFVFFVVLYEEKYTTKKRFHYSQLAIQYQRKYNDDERNNFREKNTNTLKWLVDSAVCSQIEQRSHNH